jgi:hypothetical protein
LRIDGVVPADYVVVDAVLREPRAGRDPVEPSEIRVVVAEQQIGLDAVRIRPGEQFQLTQEGVVDGDCA